MIFNIKNRSLSGSIKRVAAIILFCLACPLIHADSLWGSLNENKLGAYPDIVATITGGNGSIIRTGLHEYTDTGCTTGQQNIGFNGTAFSYTSGDTYKANLSKFYSFMFTNIIRSAEVFIFDTGFTNEATSVCLQVNCTSTSACTFTPSTGITLAF